VGGCYDGLAVGSSGSSFSFSHHLWKVAPVVRTGPTFDKRETMEANFPASSAEPNYSSPQKVSTSVKDRISALNRQIDGDVSPPSIDNQLSPMPMGALPKSQSSSRLQLPTSSPSKTAQLLKAANVIRKSFDSETEILSRSRGAGCAQLISNPKDGKPPRQNESQRSELPSPPDIFRTVKNDGAEGGNEENKEKDDLEAVNSVTSEDILDADTAPRESRRYISREESNASRPIAAGSFNITEIMPLAIDPDDPKDLHTLGKPYRGHARRSRLRSPRVLLTSLDVDSTDGAQSVTSIQSASSQKSSSLQVPTLSSRALKFLKDKKGRQKAESNPNTEVIGEASEQVVKKSSHPVGALVEAAHKLKCGSPYEEIGAGGAMVGRPQTIRLKPAVPETTNHISDLNRDVSDQHMYQTPFLSHDNPQVPQTTDQISDLNRDVSDQHMYQSPSLSHNDHQGNSYSDDFIHNNTSTTRDLLYQGTASVDDSNYSGVKARYLFDVHEEMSATSRPDHASESDFDAFTRGGGIPFDSACHALDMINPRPLIESALNAIYLGNDTFQKAIFCNTSRVASCDEAPWDEDENVCIEVEHVEQLMEHRSHAETDSYYSESIRSGSLRSESILDHAGTS
jgi:hypothetical protein